MRSGAVCFVPETLPIDTKEKIPLSGCGSASSATRLSWGKYKSNSRTSPFSKSIKHTAWYLKLLHRQHSFCTREKPKNAAAATTIIRTRLRIFCHLFTENHFFLWLYAAYRLNKFSTKSTRRSGRGFGRKSTTQGCQSAQPSQKSSSSQTSLAL